MFSDRRMNPYAPLVTDQKGNAIMGGKSPITVNAPPMQDQPTLMQQMGPTLANKAMESEAGTGFINKALLGGGSNLAQAKGLMDVAAAAPGGKMSPLAAQAVLGSGSAAAPAVAQAAGTTGTSLGGIMAGGGKAGAPALAAAMPILAPLAIGYALTR